MRLGSRVDDVGQKNLNLPLQWRHPQKSHIQNFLSFLSKPQDFPHL